MIAPTSRTLPGLLREQALARPEHPAVLSPLGTRSYSGLLAQSQAAAGILRDFGVGPGSTVALLVPNRPEWIDIAFGALSTAARVAAFNTWVKAWDLEYLLEHAAPEVLVTVPSVGRHDLLGELRQLVPEAWGDAPGLWRSTRFPSLRYVVVLDDEPPLGMYSWSRLVDEYEGPGSAALDPPELKGNDTAFVLYTSGSAAYPKAVPLVHGDLIANAFEIGERQQLTPRDRVWLASPLFWSFGCANAMLAAFSHGATLVLQPQFDPVASATTLAEYRCTSAYLLPAMVEQLASEVGDEIRAVESLRTGVTIGRPDEIRRVVDLGIKEICNVYGSTETYGNCCVTPCDLPLERRLESQGPPLPGVEVRIVGSDGSLCAAGQVGEIQVRGRVTPGYVGDPEGTAAAFTDDGWFRTGDLGSLDADGYLHFVGRATEMIKSSGINIAPAEIERFLQQHESIAEVVVVGAPHPVKGEVPVAFVRARHGAVVEADELVSLCRRTIASYKVPAAIEICDEIPRTTTGKVSRRALKERAREVVAGAVGSAGAPSRTGGG